MKRNCLREAGPGDELVARTAANVFSRLGVSAFVHVDMDAVRHNIRLVKSLVKPHTGVMGVVKGWGYGAGVQLVAEALLEEGVQELCVATVAEGVHLRAQGVDVPITVLGNVRESELDQVTQYQLVPSISWSQALTQQPRDALIYPDGSRLQVAVKVDTGMSRFGVQPQELPGLLQTLDHLHVSVASLYTQFQAAINQPNSNKAQLDLFLQATEPYIGKGIRRHAAATTGLVQGLGTDLDLVRPGAAITGICPASDQESVQIFAGCGFQPALSVVAQPTFYKLLPPERSVGYNATYQTTSKEWIANFNLGWLDGPIRRLGNGVGAVRRVSTGELCPIVGNVSMDSFTARLPDAPGIHEIFQVITADFDDVTSAVGAARSIGEAVYQMNACWNPRVARAYSSHGRLLHVLPPLPAAIHAPTLCNYSEAMISETQLFK